MFGVWLDKWIKKYLYLYFLNIKTILGQGQLSNRVRLPLIIELVVGTSCPCVKESFSKTLKPKLLHVSVYVGGEQKHLPGM